jgi:hypothetical protein
MARQPLVRFNNGVYTDQRQQDSVQNTLSPIQESQIVFGNLVSVSVVSGNNFIQHNLGRPYVMYLIAGQNAIVDLIEIEDNPNRSSQLILNSSGSANIRLWIA